MSAVVLPAASADFTSTQVIFSNSTRSACARGAARADPAASIREAVPPAINISKETENDMRIGSVSCNPCSGLCYQACELYERAPISKNIGARSLHTYNNFILN